MIGEMSYLGRGENFHFQRALFFRPPAGNSLVSVFLVKEVW